MTSFSRHVLKLGLAGPLTAAALATSAAADPSWQSRYYGLYYGAYYGAAVDPYYYQPTYGWSGYAGYSGYAPWGAGYGYVPSYPSYWRPQTYAIVTTAPAYAYARAPAYAAYDGPVVTRPVRAPVYGSAAVAAVPIYGAAETENTDGNATYVLQGLPSSMGVPEWRYFQGRYDTNATLNW